ncbi:MAG: LPS assembly protein LptD [Luteolibacter sp.]|uniref:LPS assembly protein LptD n=1 Tax=Luteolibacter sp. TaxID=1962973 RepID=UPI00326516D3
MLKLGAWIISPLLFLPLAAQDTQVLPEEAAGVPPVDTITPVPAPEIPFGAAVDMKQAMPANLKLVTDGPISFVKDVGVNFEGPGLKLTGDDGQEVFADRAVVDFKAKTATMSGHVSIYQGNILQRGEQVVYYYERKFLDTRNLKVSLDPILLEAGKFTVENRDGKNVYVGEDAGITTHDVEDPNFWIRSKKTTIYPGEKVVFEDMRVYAGDIPVFWLPYLAQPLDPELGYHFIPGARSNWGPYLLNTYGMMLGGDLDEKTGENKDAWLLSRWHLDLRGKRGAGTGVDFVDTRLENRDEFTGLTMYYLNDLAPDTSTTGIPRGFVNEDRYEFSLKNRWKLDFPDHDADWRLDANLSLLSDAYYLQDFEPVQFRTDPTPDNTIGIYRRDENSLLSLYTRLRINDFYRTDTRLPEISFDQSPAPLFGLPILHEGSTSLGWIGEQAADFTRDQAVNPLMLLKANDPAAQPLLDQLHGYERQLAEQILALPLNDPRRKEIRNQLLESNYTRFNTYQEFTMPFMVGNFLSIAPQAGLGYTNYSAVDGPVDGFDKTTLHGGIEASVKFSKDYGDYRNSRWGLDGLKHVIQPYSYWSIVSTDDYEPGDPFVDRLTPTTRPRLLDPSRFVAVDDMQSWNIVRMGTRNRLLTRRDNQSYEWLFVDTYIDAFIEDPEGQRNYSNLYNDVRWQPVPWLGVDLETQFPVVSGGSGFNEYNSLVRFIPNDFFQFGIGYRVLSGHPVLQDSNAVDLETYTRLSENWGIGTQHIIEFDDGTLELEQYTIHRDLGNWVAGIGLSHRDNRLQQEYGVIFSLTLKDFPAVSLPFELDGQ